MLGGWDTGRPDHICLAIKTVTTRRSAKIKGNRTTTFNVCRLDILHRCPHRLHKGCKMTLLLWLAVVTHRQARAGMWQPSGRSELAYDTFWLAQRQTVKNYQNPTDSSLNKTKQKEPWKTNCHEVTWTKIQIKADAAKYGLLAGLLEAGCCQYSDFII